MPAYKPASHNQQLYCSFAFVYYVWKWKHKDEA
jgi:hypothetical protein